MNKEAVYNQLKIDEGVVYETYLDHLGVRVWISGDAGKQAGGGGIQ